MYIITHWVVDKKSWKKENNNNNLLRIFINNGQYVAKDTQAH